MKTAVTEATPAVAIEIPREGKARTEWQISGKLPDAKEPSSKAESTPAHPADEAQADSETRTASEAESTQEHKKPGKRTSDAGTRLGEILEDLKRAGLTPAELKTFKREAQAEAKKAESQPAPAKQETPKPKAPDKPKIDDFKTLAEYDDAHDKWVDEMTTYKATEAVAKMRAEEAQKVAEKEFQSKIDEAKSRYPDFMETIEPARQAIFEDKDVHPAVKAMVDASPVFVDLLYVIGKKSDDMARLTKLSKTNPIEAIREIVLLDALVREERSGKAKEEVVKVPAKRVPTAPDPGYEASGTATSPGDVVAEAVKKSDYVAFAAEQNRRDIARRKGR